MTKEEVIIEFRLDKLAKGTNAGQTGHYVHRNHDGTGWCMRYGDTQRTRYYDNYCVKPEDRTSTTHLTITEDEIEKHIVIARREAKNAVARLQNLEKLQLELCLRRQSQSELMANGSRRAAQPGPTDYENSSAD